VHFLPAVGQKEREIYNEDQKILGEINRHVVTEEFAREILEQKPEQKKVESVTPIIEHGDNEGAGNKDHDGVRQADEAAGNYVFGGFPGRNGDKHKKPEYEEWVAAEFSG
jgi:hypothetical protein